MLIEVSNLKKSYKIDGNKEQKVLNGVSFSLSKGELVAVVGESGSGKSTLLNVLGGLDSDYSGEVVVAGKNLRNFKQKELDDYRKLKVGFVFQSFNLIPTYTVLENILIPADMTTASDKEKREKALALIKKLGLSGLENKKPTLLSGGERQRTAIARALINDPDIILADEPTGALDKENAANIISLLKKIANEGKLVLVVTHSQTVAESCGRTIRMGYGTVAGDNVRYITKNTENPSIETEQSKIKSKSLNYFKALSSAFKNIKNNRVRNILVSLGTGIGIFSVVILLFLSEGIGGYVETQMYSQTNPLFMEVTKASESSARRLLSAVQSAPLTEEDILAISGIEGIGSLEYGVMIVGSTTIVIDEKTDNIAMLSTVNSGYSPDLKKGEMPSIGEILINEAVADSIGIADIVGKNITLKINVDDSISERSFVVSGIIENDGTAAGRFKTAYVNFEDIAAMYESMKTPAPVSSIYLTAEKQAFVNSIKTELSEMGFDSGSRDAAFDRILDFISIVTVGLTGIAAVSLIVSGVMILVVLFISVVERTKEIGTLRALGARSSDIRRVFVAEGALIGFFSGVFGIIIAVLISLLANFLATRILGTTLFAIKAEHVLEGLIIGLIVSIPASLIPANKASKLDPIESLRHE